MKSKIKVLPIFLSILILITSMYNCTIVVYADNIIETSWKKFDDWCTKKGLKYFDLIPFAVAQVGAIVKSYDFEQFLQNQDSMFELWNRDSVCPVTVKESTNDKESDTITFSQDFVSLIKQALKEYAASTSGYTVIPTQRADMASASAFGDYYRYQSFRAFTKEYGIVAASNNGSSASTRLITFPGYSSGDVGFYVTQEYDTVYTIKPLDFKSWTAPYDLPRFEMADYKEIVHTWDEVIEKAPASNNKLKYFPHTGSYSDSPYTIAVSRTDNIISSWTNYYTLYSEDARHILLFRSKTALENYSVEHRTVYFGSGFYDETGSITVSYDELEKYLDGKYDSFLDELRDIIGDSNLTEDEIEKIVDKLIGKIGEIGDSVGGVNDNLKETNSWLEKIHAVLTDIDSTVASALSGISFDFDFDTSAIEEYLDAILAQLGYISDQIDGMTAEELDGKSDSLIDSLKSLFTDVGDLMKTKFPFSIPWDIYYFLTFLSGGGGGGEPAQVSSYGYTVYSSGFLIEIYGRPGEGTDGDGNPIGDSGGHGPGHNFGGHSFGEKGAYRPGSFYLTDKGAPAFKIPLAIKSVGIEEEVVVSLENFGILSYISRALFTCLFGYGLINLTIKVMGVGKEL